MTTSARSTDAVTGPPAADIRQISSRLTDQGVDGVQIGWVDNNGIVRSRIVPIAEFEAASRRGVGVTAAFAVFDSQDGITFAHEGLSTPSGDVRLVPAIGDAADVVQLTGQPHLAWVNARQVSPDGDSWPYCQRAVLERQVERAAAMGLQMKAGYEIEMVLSREGEDYAPAHRGPAYGPNALRDVDEFVARLLRDLAANGIEIGQLHAEYGESQVEIALAAMDPLKLADTQVVARQTIHSAARAEGLRASFAPVTTVAGAGNGWHLHTSMSRDGSNILPGSGAHGLSGEGRAYLGGLLRELPAIVAVSAPSTGSLLRRRPGYWAGAYGFWGVENREAALRLVPDSALLGPERTNIELKASDASANPYLALAMVLGAGLAGIADNAALPEPVQEDVGTWDEAARSTAGIKPLASTHEEQRAHLHESSLAREVLGEQALGAFLACRDADAAWAAERSVEDIVEAHRWLY
ncbi:MAG: glutamine synthetase family protein [Ornithinimicrobium sp.]